MSLKTLGYLLDVVNALLAAQASSPEIVEATETLKKAKAEYEAALEAMDDVERSDDPLSDDDLRDRLGSVGGSTGGD